MATKRRSSPRQRALVTGASRGIGRAIALDLGALGFELALSARSTEALEPVMIELKDRGVRAHALAADLAETGDVQMLARDAFDALGEIGVLVNNAGIAMAAPLERQGVEAFDQMMAVNARAPYLLMQALIPGMKKQGWGRIVNIASVSGIQGDPYITAYCATKHAVVGFTRAAAKELGSHGITVNAVCPGYVDTDMTAETVRNIVKKTGRTAGETRAELEAYNPQKRIFTAGEVAATAVFLVSDGARGINGQCLTICGGETA